VLVLLLRDGLTAFVFGVGVDILDGGLTVL
jgi:hypothetical protein